MKLPAAVEEIYECAYHLYTAGKYAESEKVFRILTSMDSFNINYWIGLGASLQLQSKHQQAVDVFGAAALIDADEINPFPHLHAAECLHLLGKDSLAITALDSAILIASKTEKHHSLLSQLRFLHERWTYGRIAKL